MDDDTAEAVMITLSDTTERDLLSLDGLEAWKIFSLVPQSLPAQFASQAGL